MPLLHISGGAVAVAVGIILAILAIEMVAGHSKKIVEEFAVKEDPSQIVPVGITILIIASDEVVSVASVVLVVGLLLLIGAFDYFCQHRQVVKTIKSHHPGYFGSCVRDLADCSCSSVSS
jgi:small neutral amino acid transporter SnatA (MarC family)